MVHLPQTADWLYRQQTQDIMACLNGQSADDKVRAVGGCVRDSLLNQPVTDVDMATSFAPQDTLARLEAGGFRVIPTGIAHGTIMVVVDGYHYEITSLRQDIETDGRHAIVRFGTDWQCDAERRDFTVNALYADAKGQIYDPLGCGLDDLSAKQVRFIGDADQRIAEDYLRAIRFFRFHFHLADGALDKDALTACKQAVEQEEGLRALSAERLWMELNKILTGRRPVDALTAMQTTGVLHFLLPVLAGFDRLARLVEDKEADALLRLAALLPDKEQAIIQTAHHLRLSNKQKTRLLALCDKSLRASMAENWQEAVYWHGKQAVADFARLRQDEFNFSALADFDCPKFPLTGEMVEQKGVSSGPYMGQLLKQVEQWWVAAGFPDDRDALERQLKAEMEKL